MDSHSIQSIHSIQRIIHPAADPATAATPAGHIVIIGMHDVSGGRPDMNGK